MKHYLNENWKIARFCVEAIGTAVVTTESGKAILSAARHIRGYANPGGELFLVLIIFGVTLFVLHKAMNKLEEYLNAELRKRAEERIKQQHRNASKGRMFTIVAGNPESNGKAAQNF